MESDFSTGTMGTGLRGSLVERRSVAGLTLAAYAIPVALAHATLAGLPPQVGIYRYQLGGLGYALFGSSRHLAIGPTSAAKKKVETDRGRSECITCNR
jgi:sulfate permease, SulP family